MKSNTGPGLLKIFNTTNNFFAGGVSNEKPPLHVKPRDAVSQNPQYGLQFGMSNGRVPAGSVALPGIHSVAAVAAARAALTSHQPTHAMNGRTGSSSGFTLTSTSRNQMSNLQQESSNQHPPSPTMLGHQQLMHQLQQQQQQQQQQEQQHPFYGLPSSFQTKNSKERQAPQGAPSAPQQQQQVAAPPPKQGKSSSSSSSRHWLSCYHASTSSSTSSSKSPSPPPSIKGEEQDSETPSPTDHGFKPVNASGFERPTSLPVLGAFALNGEPPFKVDPTGRLYFCSGCIYFVSSMGVPRLSSPWKF